MRQTVAPQRGTWIIEAKLRSDRPNVFINQIKKYNLAVICERGYVGRYTWEEIRGKEYMGGVYAPRGGTWEAWGN